MSTGEVTDDDLQAYVDDELDPKRRPLVLAYLAARPDEARCVADWAEQRAALRAALAELEDGGLPERRDVRLRRATWTVFTPRALRWRAAALAVALLVLGGALGYSLRAWLAPAERHTRMSERADELRRGALVAEDG